MKKLFLITSLLSFLLVNPLISFAKETNATPSATIQRVQYELPYPGLLPDNPLYYLKAIRDNVLKFLISNPLKKAQFDLLQADKRLGAASLLLAKQKPDLSITTLSKSGNYFDDAIVSIQKAQKEGDDVNSTLDQMLKSSQKHQEIILNMQKGQKGDTLLNLKFLEQRAKDFQERVLIIKSQ
ncbi:MAG: hypothetical protein HY344_03165 [Candidatus Levybacteria bacterium]|nr:hypothetical protein [Candidatus Levybacteria bacterium]